MESELNVILLAVSAAILFAAVAGVLHLSAKDAAQLGNNEKIRWQDSLYDAFFRNKDEKKIAGLLGVKKEKYEKNCRLLHIEPDYKQIIAVKVCGIIVLILFGTLGLLRSNIRFTLLGIFGFIPLFFLQIANINSNATKKRQQILIDLPRFLGLFHAALRAKLTVVNALTFVADNQKHTILGQEIKWITDRLKITGEQWEEVLAEESKYVDTTEFTLFVTDLSIAHTTGTPIVDSIDRLMTDVDKSYIADLQYRAGKLTNIIMFPLFVFKIIPLIAIMCIPIISSLNTSGLI